MNIGIDLTNIKRKEFKSEKFAQRFCTENEFLFYKQKPNKKAKISYLASLWAIKEAILKATNKQYGIHEIEVIKTNEGSKVNLLNHEVNISLSYENKFVIAVVIVKVKGVQNE